MLHRLKRIVELIELLKCWFHDTYLTPFIHFRQLRKDIQFTQKKISSAKRLFLVSHFDQDGLADAYFRKLVSSLTTLEDSYVIVISTSEASRIREEQFKEICDRLIVKKNIGKDFGAWKFVVEMLHKTGLDFTQFSSVCFFNDSIYGPFTDVTGFITKIEQIAEPALGGITDSWDIRYHLQSYFFIFNRPALEKSVFLDFWRNRVRYYKSRNRIIGEFEIGLTQQMLRSGLRIVPLCDYRQVRNRALEKGVLANLPFSVATYTSVNPSHFFWDILCEDFGCPFIKVELLKANPAKITNIPVRFDNIVPSEFRPPIVAHLRRVGSNFSV